MPHPRDYSEGGCPAGSLVFLDSTEIHESSPLALVSRRRRSRAEHFVGRYMRAHCSIREDGKPPPPSASSQCHETQPTSSSPWRALDSSTRPIPREISKESWNCS